MSLADCTTSILSASSTVTMVPGGYPILEGAILAARLETTIGIPPSIRPSRIALNTV